MTKKKRQKQSVLHLLSLVLGLVSVVMIFLPAVNYSTFKDVTDRLTGLEVIFGVRIVESLKAKVFEFSIMYLLPYVLALGGLVVAVLSYLAGGNKLFAFISAGAFIASAVFFFLYPSFLILTKFSLLIKENFSLGIGSIIGGISSALAGFFSLGQVVKK